MLCFSLQSRAVFSETTKPKALLEMLLDPKQKKEIQEDLPAKAILIDGFENTWFIGTHYLWKWDGVRKTLDQIKLTTTQKLKNLSYNEDSIFVANDEFLFKLGRDPLKVLSVQNPEKNSHSLAIQCEKNINYWIKTDGIYKFSDEPLALEKILQHTLRDKPDDKFIFSPDTPLLWMLKNGDLSYIKYTKYKKSGKIIKVANNIRDIQRSQEEIFAISEHLIFRYSKFGKLIQTVPVHSGRRLVLSSLDPRSHMYVFHDRLLEVHSPTSHKTFHYFLDVGHVQKAEKMSVQESQLALILDGNPRFFKFLDNPWLTPDAAPISH
jgi:hypothetical protein